MMTLSMWLLKRLWRSHFILTVLPKDVGSILLTWSDDIKHTSDDSRGQALLFIWHHSTPYILCCGVDLIKWNCLFHQSPEDTLMFSPDWTGHQTYFVSLRPPWAAASSNFRQMCSNLSFQDIFSLEKSPSFIARLYRFFSDRTQTLKILTSAETENIEIEILCDIVIAVSLNVQIFYLRSEMSTEIALSWQLGTTFHRLQNICLKRPLTLFSPQDNVK